MTATDQPVSEIEIMQTGTHVSHGKGDYALDDPERFIRESMEIAQRRYAGELLIDFDHASEVRGIGNKHTVAAGWITGLRHAPERSRIMARVRWTPLGAAAIRQRLYRFVSPTFANDGHTIACMVRAGLTNNPGAVLAPLELPPAEGAVSDVSLAQFLRMN